MVVVLNEADLRAFERSGPENARFWSRFPTTPDLRGASVLEVGCGRGRLCLDMALAGATRVVGLDVLEPLVDFARENVKQHHPRFASRIEFRRANLPDLADDETFDFIVTKDALEHVLDIDGMLRAMLSRLKPGGRIFAGFGPLYTSPYGDHDRRVRAFARFGPLGRLMTAMPWGHLVFEPLMIREYARSRGVNLETLHDLCLNGLSYSDYRNAIDKAGLRVASARMNQGPTLPAHLLSLLSRIKPLEDYCVFNAYLVLERAAVASGAGAAEQPPERIAV